MPRRPGSMRCPSWTSVFAAAALVAASFACTCSEEPVPNDEPVLDTDVVDDAPPEEPPVAGEPRGKRGKRGKRRVDDPSGGTPEEGGGEGGGGGGGGGGTPPAGITYLGDNRWNVDRKLAESYESNPDKLGCSAKEHGKGWELTGVGSNDDAYYLGARNGDVVMSVNGLPMDSTTDLLLMWSKLDGADDLVVDMKREGNPLTLHYHLVD